MHEETKDKKNEEGVVDKVMEKVSEPLEDKDDLKQSIKRGFDELSEKIKQTKIRYEKTDPQTKKNLLTGVAGALAFLAGVVSACALTKKNKK